MFLSDHVRNPKCVDGDGMRSCSLFRSKVERVLLFFPYYRACCSKALDHWFVSLKLSRRVSEFKEKVNVIFIHSIHFHFGQSLSDVQIKQVI